MANKNQAPVEDFNFDFNPEAVMAAQGERTAPRGEYLLQIRKAWATTSKKGMPMIVFMLQIVGGHPDRGYDETVPYKAINLYSLIPNKKMDPQTFAKSEFEWGNFLRAFALDGAWLKSLFANASALGAFAPVAEGETAPKIEIPDLANRNGKANVKEKAETDREKKPTGNMVNEVQSWVKP